MVDPAWFLGDFEFGVGRVVSAEGAVALLRGPGTPIRVASDWDIVYEDFGPFNIGPCFDVRKGESDVVCFVIVLDIRGYVMCGFVKL